MYHFLITDPNVGLADVTRKILSEGLRADSRNGEVLRFARPVCLEYQNPQRRILDWEARDGNPFFHHWETMWMLAGREDVAPLLLFNKQILQYSDDGVILRGTAYGKRWRSHFGFDQLQRVIQRLRSMPEDRRAVLTMWDVHDLEGDTQDFACNMQVIFTTRPDPEKGGFILDMTVTNRSNDLIYGSMGSNLFHFSMLHEFVAVRTGHRLGTYYQISANLHVYTQNPVAQRVIQAVKDEVEIPNAPPPDAALSELSLPEHSESAELDSQYFNNLIDWGLPRAKEGDYISSLARPLAEAYRVFKQGTLLPDSSRPSKTERLKLISNILQGIPSPLGAAGQRWMERRLS